MQSIKWGFFLILGFYLCGILTVIPLAPEYQWYRPQWLFMLVIFCQLQQPKLFNPLIAWVIGLLLDSLLGTRLGEYALICTIISYLTYFFAPNFSVSPLWSQWGKIFLLVCLAQIFILWFHALAGENPQTLLYWAGSVVSTLIWPVFVLLLQSLSRLLGIQPIKSRMHTI